MNAARGGVVVGSEVVAGVGGCYWFAGLRVCNLRRKTVSCSGALVLAPEMKASTSALAQAAALSVLRLRHRSLVRCTPERGSELARRSPCRRRGGTGAEARYARERSDVGVCRGRALAG